MRRAGKMVFTFALVIALAAPALAQDQQRQRGQRGGQRGGFGMGGPGQLLENESVQKELQVDQDQADKIKEAVQKVREKHQDEFAKLRDLSQEERREKGQELSRTVSQETLTAVNDILKPEQLKRFKQIELQQEGSRAFTQPEVQKALSLTDEQKEKIKTIDEDAAKERRDLFQAGNFRESREKMTALRKETMEKVQAVLTDDQKKTYKDLTGEAFEVQRAQRRPRNNNQ